MATTKYTPSKVRVLLRAQEILNAVPAGQDWTVERDLLTLAEESLSVEGWKNLESEAELRAIAAQE